MSRRFLGLCTGVVVALGVSLLRVSEPRATSAPSDAATVEAAGAKRRARGGRTAIRVDVAAADASLAPRPDERSPSVARGCGEPYVPASRPPDRPPFAGTAYVSANIITEADPSSFAALTARGTGSRVMFDRRTARFGSVNARLFDARFGASTSVEIQVNPEFSAVEAEREARTYAAVIGRLPAALFRDLRTVWIHRGDFDFGGGNNNLLIHTDRGAAHARGGVLEEILLHEATHTSLDADHRGSARWREAQRADGAWLSVYARDNAEREDLAETLGLYLAQRFRADRLPASVVQSIRATIPSRIAYLDCVELSMTVLQ